MVNQSTFSTRTKLFTSTSGRQCFRFSAGTKKFLLERSDDAEINREVDEICNQYLQGKKKISVLNVESVSLGSNSEVVFIRSFLLLFITKVLCPSTYNFVNPKYLFSLRDSDIEEVYNLDFASLNNLWNEMNSWKAKILQDKSESNRILWIGGCLPLLAVVYMDFLDFEVLLIIICLECHI